ncbi:NAD kinase [Corynebacterium sp. TAE3-ERU12]|uniref:NAD kinase n=1 Tax=Corynebacterium sp. TAE3-ERU12 TaxID=2849491 RepID=UPI001C492132|nr:NAD kinase [Corynebacterium sp. TAE3-ERU12]MBV7295528.1 NAD kinase [Corynebacterium sp. TAE3-ERU12]
MTRRVLLVPHTGRANNLEAAAEAATELDKNGIDVRVLAGDYPEMLIRHPVLGSFPRFGHSAEAADGCELVLVLGGDGTFLRAADIAYSNDLPVLGINMGHVGFLAEWEQESMAEAIGRVIDRKWRIEDRMTLKVVVRDSHGYITGEGWALNELSLENMNRRGVLDVVLEVDRRPVSSYGCDGVLVSTPTGSTAYAFSAGGPVLWPELDAMLVVPNNAHALFDRPLVVAPGSLIAVETSPSGGPAQAMLDGFRQLMVPPGSRMEITRAEQPVRWVRLDSVPFADRLVHKFRLPVTGWRGPRE